MPATPSSTSARSMARRCACCSRRQRPRRRTWWRTTTRSAGARSEGLELDPAGRWVLARMDGTAVLACARVGVGIERLVERRQVLHQVLDLHLDTVYERAAFEAVPFEGVELVRPRRLDHEPDRARLRALRRMPHMRGQQKDVARADRDVVELPVVDDLQQHVALELIEELLDRVVVIVGPLVRTADHLYGHLTVLEHLLV